MKVGMTIKSVSATQKSQYENMMKTCIEHIIDKYDVNIFIYPHVTVDDDVEESIKVYRMLADKYKSNVTVLQIIIKVVNLNICIHIWIIS